MNSYYSSFIAVMKLPEVLCFALNKFSKFNKMQLKSTVVAFHRVAQKKCTTMQSVNII